MQDMKKLFFLFCLSLLLITACKKESVLVNMHYDYFPVETGTWIIYDVDSIYYNDFTQTVDTFYFQVKEVIESTFTDNEGRLAQRIERYYRPHADSVWQIKNVWYANRTAKSAERVEENVRVTKLIFPVIKDEKWNGNAANTLGGITYSYKDVHYSTTVNNHLFDSCIAVQHENELTIFTQKFSEEIYAKHIGKIYRNHINLNKLADGTITSGFRYTYKASSWGN